MMASKNFLRRAKVAGVVALLAACGGKSGSTSGGGGPAPQVTATPSAAGPTGDNAAYTVAVVSASNQLPAKSTAAAGDVTCSAITATVQLGGAPKSDVVVVYSLSLVDGKNYGSLSALSAKTDAEGKAVVQFCTGDEEAAMTIFAKAGATKANTQPVQISKRNIYTISYVPRANTEDQNALGQGSASLAEAAATAAAAASTSDSQKVILVSLADYPDANCSELDFAVTKNGVKLAGATVLAQSQEDVPGGAKLATATGTPTTAVNPVTKRSSLTFTAQTDSGGVARIPVCGGVQPGTLNITATLTAPVEAGNLIAKSPVVKIGGSIPTWGNLSITFDPKNARIIPGSFTSNSSSTIDFIAELGARLDINSDIIRNWPLGILTEIGKGAVENAGIPDGTGKAKFSIKVQNLNATRPFAVFPNYSIKCLPQDFDTTRFPTGAKYSDLAKNWRNTVTYHTKGSEYFFDAKGTGKYEGPSEGFIDVDEDGAFTPGVDVLTSDLNHNGIFDPDAGTGDWFIDLPTPYVDASESKAWVASDLTLGGSFANANGAWDSFTTIWKHFYMPLYMGVSHYSMLHNVISADPAQVVTPTLAGFFTANKYSSSLAASPTTTLFGNTGSDMLINTGAQVGIARYTFAHDVCGSPLPGGAKISLTEEVLSTSSVGDRPVHMHIYEQPTDFVLDDSRILLQADGTSAATMNFQAYDHPAAAEAYPVQFYIQVEQCNNLCKGPVTDPFKVACSGKSSNIHLTLDDRTISSPLYVNSYRDCACSANASFTSFDSCACDNGYQQSGYSCVIPPP